MSSKMGVRHVDIKREHRTKLHTFLSPARNSCPSLKKLESFAKARVDPVYILSLGLPVEQMSMSSRCKSQHFFSK